MFSAFSFMGGGFTSSGYPLDDFPDAEAAYSFRRLRSDFTGSVVKLKRTFDSTSQEFTFASGSDYLDTGSADSFCSAGGGLCTIEYWYDQSGNTRHIGGGAFAPEYADAPDLTPTKKSIYFDGVNDGLERDAGAGTLVFFSTASTEILVVNDAAYSFIDINDDPRGLKWTTTNIEVEPSASAVVPFSASITSSIIGGILDSTIFYGWGDGVFKGQDIIASGVTGSMAAYGGAPGAYLEGYHFEYIRWNKTIENKNLKILMDSTNDFYDTPNYTY